MKCVKSVAQGKTEPLKGRQAVLPAVAFTMLITARGAFMATKSSVWTISLLRPVALGAVAAAGCAHLLSNGVKDNFTCSRWFLAMLFRDRC